MGVWAPRGLLPAVLCLPLPLLLWAAVRFGARGASAAILTVTVVSIWLTLNGATIFVDADAERSVLALQLFLTGIAVPMLVLGATMEGLWRVEQMTSAQPTLFSLRASNPVQEHGVGTQYPLNSGLIGGPAPCAVLDRCVAG